MKTNAKLLIAALFIISGFIQSFAQKDIISPAEFMKLIKDKNTVVIDVNKKKTYATTHIKGAVNIPHKSLYKDGEVPGLIKSPKDLAGIFGSKGISEKNTIVVYGDGSQKYSSRVYWILKYLGAPNVKILHKDMNAWRSVRVPLTSMASKRKAVTFTPNVNKDIFVDKVYVKSKLNDGSVKLVDSRTKAEFDGTDETGKSDGHLPGAVNLNYENFLTGKKTYKSKEEIEKIVQSAGLSADQEIIVYCNTGIKAAVNFIVFKNILSYPNVKVYEGSYKDWVVDNMVVK